MTPPLHPDAERRTDKARLTWLFARDLSTLTPGEAEAKWDTRGRAALSAAGVSFEERVQQPTAPHNPFYYLAERVFFDNVAGDPRWLYPPLHRDRLCIDALKFFTDPASQRLSGFLNLMSRDLLKTTFSHGVFPVTLTLRDYVLHSRRDGDGKVLHPDIPNIALVHHKEAMAHANLRRLKERVRFNAWFRETWPEFVPPDKLKKWGDSGSLLWPCAPRGQAEASILATGLSGSLTGFHTRYRFNSDMVTEEHLKSQAVRLEAANFYDASRYTRESLRFLEWNDGTRYHVQDLYGRMLKANVEGQALYALLLVPAIGPNDELAHPYRLPKKYLEQLRQEEISRVGHDLYWNLQMQCDAKSSTVDVADSTWLQWVNDDAVPTDGWFTLHIDSAWKGSHNQGMGDYACGWVVCNARRGSLVHRYFIDGFYSNELGVAEGHAESRRLMRKYGLFDVSYEEYGGHGLRSTFEAECVSHGLPCNLIDLKNKPQHKTQRMLSFTRAAQAHTIFVCDSIPRDMREALNNFMDDFPQAKPDDIGDAASQAFDPAVMEAYAPRRPVGPWWVQRPEPAETVRTRYSGI